MDFRKADTNDIPCLVEFRKQQLLDEGLAPVNNMDSELVEWFAASLSDGSLISWLAVDGDKIVASSGVCLFKFPPAYSAPNGRLAYITNMYTLPEYRKQGIGSHLLGLVMNEAKALDCKRLLLHASADGRPLYEKAGFTDADGFMMMRL